MASTQSEDEAEWVPRFRIDEELEFFTDLALQETERWLKAVTKKKLSHPDDLRRSLQNGVLLCELVNGLKPGSVARINKLSTPIAGLDNLTVFLRACQDHFGLRQPQLFDPLDLEDLSQRAAFADDDPCYLKQETERRLRNVALTVYWLGQSVRGVYTGPQLDQSAFSGLVAQNPGILSPDQSPQRSWNSYYGGSPGRVTSPHSDSSEQCAHSVSLPDEHALSEESYGSEGGFSLDNELGEDMYRHNSSSNLSRWGNAGGSRGPYESSSVYSNHDLAMYRSSPNLSQGSHSHTRSSSTDSLDGGQGFHSRHSSGSGENYLMRRVSGSGRPSVTANPLQFVKTPTASQLAQAAQEQIKITEESKKIKWDTLHDTTEDNDWQSKLGSWKSKRRSQSAASYERKEEAEAHEKDQEEKALRTTKTFTEIVKEREKRKSMNSYPIEEDDEDYSTSNNNQSNDINHNQTGTNRKKEITGSFDDSAVFEQAPWAASSDDDTNRNSSQVDTRLGNGVPSESDTESNKENWTEDGDSHNNNNNIEQVSHKYNRTTINSNKTAPTTQRTVGSKLSSIRKAFEEQAESDNSEYKPLTRRAPRNNNVTNNQSSVPADEPKVSPRSPRSDKDFVEKAITISQKPNSEKGFGFNFSGGRDKGQPVVVERVSLGGAADVCEVRVKDEITEINRRKVATYSHSQVQDLIKRAVQTGKLELKVKRYIRKGTHLSDEFSEEDSFDRFEEKMEREEENLRNKSSAFTPMIDSLLRENSDRRASWEEEEEEHNDTEMDQGETTYSQRSKEEDERIRPSDAHESQSENHEEPEDMRQDYSEEDEESESHLTPAETPYTESRPKEPAPTQQVEEEEVEEPVMRRQLRTERPTSKPLYPTPYTSDTLDFTPASVIQAEPGKPISFDVSVPASSVASPSDGSGIGPPKALLRWQRRPRSQYGEETEGAKEEPKTETQFNSEVSRPVEREVTRQSAPQEEVEQEIRPTATPRTRLDLSREIKKMEEWDRQQEQQRQQNQTSSPERSVTSGEKQFKKNVKAINSRWETDKQQAERRKQEKDNNDQVLLEQEKKRVDAMEERRSERRAQRQAQMAQQAEWLTNQTPQSTEMVIQLPGNSGFQIDPRNKPDITLDTSDGFQEVNFRVNVNQQSSAEPHVSSSSTEMKRQSELEEERLRLQREEQEMRRRLEEQKEAEDRRLREREEQLRRQEERLRQEEERLRQEQERLQKERQQHLQELNSPRGSSPASLPKHSPSYASSSPASISPAFNTQPDQQFSSTVVIANTAPNNYYVKSVEHSVPVQSPFYNSAINKNDSAKTSQRLTREDLMAMSRSARPLEEKPLSLQQSDSLDATTGDPKTPLSPTSPIVREPPSRQEKHSLNAVPRPKLHDSNVWIGNAKEPRQTTTANVTAPKPARRSDIMRKQYSSPQDHWLVQEAERRRLEEQNKGQRSGGRQGQQKTGPIKPHESLITNRWREKSPQFTSSKSQPNLRASTSFEQMRQKFSETPSESHFATRPSNPALQPRAAPRNFSNLPHHSRGDSAPVSRQSHNSASSNYLGGNSVRNAEHSRVSPRPAPRSRTSPTGSANSPEPTMAISGRQRCSHCQDELGYGAAMVIEPLNLHYHMQCFRCCVCHAQLGNGAEGADVRVRGWKLHCRNCYSNDEAGLKFSKV